MSSSGTDEDIGKPSPADIGGNDSTKPTDDMLTSLPPDDEHKFNAADTRRKEDDRALTAAHSRLLKLRSDLQKAQRKVDYAQQAYDKARNIAQENAEQDADDLLLEPTPWNNYYEQLKAYYDREGHSNFKRTITDADVEGLCEAEAKEIRTLSWWTCRQRKFKRRGELEQHKILLLNRLQFNWDPHAGPGPEKWLKNYTLLKEFKQKHGHVKVPVRYAENKLGSWLKTQVTQYRNAQEGKLPALSAERIRLLEEIGINWGEKRVTTPWDDRFQTLLDYKRRFGNVNVPWQWKENVALAQWVNSQRKKYKDLLEGKRNNLNEEQINRLNSIGFKWNTAGKGRYTESPTDEQSEDMMTSDQTTLPAHLAVPKATEIAAPDMSNPPQSVMTASVPPECNVANQVQNGLMGGVNFSGGLDPNSGHNIRSVLSGMNPEALAYAQRLAQQNQQDLSMLAYAHQQLNQQMNPSTKMFGQNGANPFS